MGFYTTRCEYEGSTCNRQASTSPSISRTFRFLTPLNIHGDHFVCFFSFLSLYILTIYDDGREQVGIDTRRENGIEEL